MAQSWQWGSKIAVNFFFKSMSGLNLSKLYSTKETIQTRKSDLIIHTNFFAMFERNSPRCSQPHIWNTLPVNIKEINSFKKSKESINNWYEPSCRCSLCYYRILQKLNLF